MMKCPRGLVVLLTLLVTAPAGAQHVEAYLSTDTAAVGDRFTLTVVALHGFDEPPSFPDALAQDSTFGDLEVLGLLASGRHAVDDGAARLDSVVYEVTTFALDTAVVPPLAVSFNGESHVATSPPFYLPIRSLVSEDAAAIRELQGLVEFGAPVWPYVLLGLAALVAVGLLVYWMRRRDEPLEISPTVVDEGPSPYDVARRRLRELEKANVDQAEAVELYYVELADVLRMYLEHRIGIPALERTTRELADEFNRPTVVHRMPGGIPQRIGGILSVADLVKFAELVPRSEESRRLLAEAIECVERTEAKQHQLERSEEMAPRAE